MNDLYFRIMKLKNWFVDFAKGGALGTGILPGVSVGTVGFIVNVYNKLVDAIAGLKSRSTFKKSFLTLLPIALGTILSAIILLFLWKKVAYEYFPFVVIAMLAGFVIGGFPVLTRELKGEPIRAIDILRMVLGFLVAASIGIISYLAASGVINLNLDFYERFANPFASPWIYIVVLVVGFIAAVACLIPGISGSMILFIFNLYNPVITIFISGRAPDGTIYPNQYSIFETSENLVARLLIVLVLLVGIIAGFILASVTMKNLLANHRRGTFGCVIGFVLGSVVSMFVNNEMYHCYTTPATSQPWQFILGAVLGLAVMAVTFYFVRKAINKENAEAQ